MCLREDKYILSAREIFQLDFAFNIINLIKLPLMKTDCTSIIIIIVIITMHYYY